MKALSDSGAAALGIVADGGQLVGIRLFPGAWHYRAIPKATPGEKTKAVLDVSEKAIVTLATRQLVTARFEDEGQNRHFLHYALTESGKRALALHDAEPKQKKSVRGAQ